MSYEMSKKCFPEALCSVTLSVRKGRRTFCGYPILPKFTFLLWGRRQNPIQVNSNR